VSLRVVRITGDSMLPTLGAGDRVLVRWGAAARPGALVVASWSHRPDVLVVKRAVRREPDGWWLEGDNPRESDDSRVHGAAQVHGRVLLRWPYRARSSA
jgi:nickel-type superoxide dismutase maturation protease